MKELMDKAQAAMADGKYVEAEAFAKRAQEIDPNEVAAVILAVEGQAPSGTTRPSSSNKRRQGGGRRRPRSRRSTRPSIADPEVQLNGHQVRQELQGPDPRAAPDERPAGDQEGPQDAGDRGEAQRAGHASTWTSSRSPRRSTSSRTTPG